MKKIIALVTIMLLLEITTVMSYAQTPTPIQSGPTKSALTPSPSSTPTKKISSDSLTEQITNLKERIASRVAELNLVEKRGLVGVATDVKGTEFTITDPHGKIRFVDVDELTEFVGTESESSFGISDIKKGTKLAVLGRYNKQSERLLARFVEVVSIPEYYSGTIESIDETNFAFVLTPTRGEEKTVDVENITKTQAYSKEDGLRRAGFSGLVNGDHILVSGFPDKNDAKRLVATRILIFEDFRKDAEGGATDTVETTIIPTKPSTPSPTQALEE